MSAGQRKGKGVVKPQTKRCRLPGYLSRVILHTPEAAMATTIPPPAVPKARCGPGVHEFGTFAVVMYCMAA
jgi:hypothetical protein